MGFEDFISETEAANRAGVSIKTLQRFSEAGYLRVEIEPDGLRLYSQSELDEIFGAHRSGSTSQTSVEGTETAPSAEVYGAESCTVIASDEATTHRTSLHQPVQETASCGDSTGATIPAYKQSPAGTASSENTKTTRSDAETPAEDSVDTSLYAIEVLKLRNIISLQEKLLDVKDAELADLKGQRDWLRARVEKLEEKSDRDQILLLSETQTIRKLISLQEQKRSPMNRLLEWLGISPQPTTKALGSGSDYANSDSLSKADRAIEIKSAGNE